ncbi:hypothetical protein IMSAGC003_00746 [Lachnospiraceae bacterium]|nr:hypothetical protein IMSAGC003_00746 [Lachnospiraceae bacterium]
MANKGAKTYNISERELQEMMRRASEAGIAAYKNEHEETTRRKAGRLLYRTKTLLERYTQLNEYAQNSVYTLERAEEVNEGIADLEVLTKFGIFDDDKTLHNLKRSVVTVNMVMAHVNTMLEVYRKECESSASKVKQRQYRVIEYLYLSENKLNTKEIAELEGEDVRTIQNDAKQAREDLTALIFGLDGVITRILRE